jgi:hypothetical protein
MCFALIGLYISFLLSQLWGRFYDDVSPDARKPVCITFSALVHYFLLVYFCITVAHSVLVYLKFVKVFGLQNYLNQYQLKFGIVSWSKYLEDYTVFHLYIKNFFALYTYQNIAILISCSINLIIWVEVVNSTAITVLKGIADNGHGSCKNIIIQRISSHHVVCRHKIIHYFNMKMNATKKLIRSIYFFS